MENPDAKDPGPTTRSAHMPPFDWRQALDQLTEVGNELRAVGAATFENLSQRAGLVTREQFEVHQTLLRSALERLEALEQRVAALGEAAASTPKAR